MDRCFASDHRLPTERIFSLMQGRICGDWRVFGECSVGGFWLTWPADHTEVGFGHSRQRTPADRALATSHAGHLSARLRRLSPPSSPLPLRLDGVDRAVKGKVPTWPSLEDRQARAAAALPARRSIS
ncbi:hypothetical protein L1887_60633 [Cichorium endivia]|nr:hypothetical protein L1887_60633 [Cichorium endivia]